MAWKKCVPKDIQDLYEIYSFRHAHAILALDFPAEFEEICQALRTFRLTETDILTPGGNESTIPKKFSTILRPMGWVEKQLKARHILDDGEEVSSDTHWVDYIKGRIAFDVEWNSKDQTFDRDLFAFRVFFEFDKISVGVLVTRSNELDPVFASFGNKIKGKYGASTTHMGKLIPRLKAGRNGGCPVLVFGITPRLLEAKK